MTATTTTAERPHVTPDPTPEALTAAADLLGRANLRMRRNLAPQAARVALARALAASGHDSPHGQQLAAALRRRSRGEAKHGPRPGPERAVRRLLEAGQVPTPAAVAGQLRNQAAHRDADQARAARIAPLVEHDAGAVAEYVADYRRRTGTGPSWGQVRRWMRHRWRYSDGDPILRALVAQGWLVASREPGSLDVGPRARGLTW